MQTPDKLASFPPQLAQIIEDYQQNLKLKPLYRTIAKHCELFTLNAPCQHYLFLLSGTIKVLSRSADGKELLLYRIQSGEACILTTSCLMANENYPDALAISETELKVWMLSKSDFNTLLDTSGEFRQWVFQSFGNRLGNLIARINQLNFERIELRLAQFLVRQPSTTIAMTHQELADELGSAREVISRHLKHFEQKNWLKITRGQIEIIADEPLQQFILNFQH